MFASLEGHGSWVVEDTFGKVVFCHLFPLPSVFQINDIRKIGALQNMILDVVCKKGKKSLEQKFIQFGVISVGIYYH